MSTATLSKNQWGFSPQNIAGCQLWLDAADTTSLTYSGTNVTAWRDKSGNGYNMNTLAAAPSGYAQAYPTTGTAINGLNTVNFSPGAGLEQGTTLDGVKNFFWVGRVSNSGAGSAAPYYFMLGHDTYYDWCGDVVTSKFISGTYAQSGIYNASPVSQYGGGSSAAVNVAFSSLLFPANGSVSFVSAAGITGTTRYQGLCYDRVGVHCGWCGDLAEVVIFNQVLTTTQIQQIEGYLASKWGLQNNLPATHPYYSSPLNTGNLVLWVDCADTTSYTLGGVTAGGAANKGKAGGRMSAPTGNTVTSAAATLNGVQAWIIQPGAVMAMPSLTFATTSRTVFVVVNIGASGGYYVYINGATSGTDLQCYSYTNGDLELNTPGTNRLITNTPTSYFSTSSIVAITSGIYIDGTSQTLAVNNGNSFSSGVTTTTMTLGGSGSAIFTLGEMMIFDGLLNTAQRQTVETYLSQKWGIALSYSGAASVIPRPVYARPFQPVDIAGCQLWLDGADATTVTGTSTVTAWADKSGQGYSMIAGTGTTTYTVYGPGPSIKLNTSYLYVNKAVDLTQFTMFSVLLSQTAVGNQPTVTGRPNTSASYGSTDGFGLYVDASGPSLRFYTSTYISDGTPASSGNSLGLVLSTYTATSAGALSSWFNGVAKSTLSTSARSSTAQGFSIGGEWNGSAYVSQSGTGSVANVYEVIVFNTVLTTSQRQQVEGYLAWKWGLMSNLASGHPGKYLPSYSPMFSPKSISGMIMWLDGADDSTITLNGSSVTVWLDKSGSGNTVTPYSGTITRATLSGNNNKVMNFGTGVMTTPNFSWASSFTQIFVAYVATGDIIIDTINPGVKYGDYIYTGNGNLMLLNTYSTNSVVVAVNDSVAGSVAPKNTWFMFCIGYGSTGTAAINYTINGTVRSTTLYAGAGGSVTNQALPLYINGNTGSAGTGVQIAELIHFNAALTTAQRQQTEGYLAWKWGLAANLPSTHPFAKISP